MSAKKPAGIDPAAQYSVVVKEAVPVGRRILLPRLNPHQVKGSILEEIKDRVSSYNLVSE
jgi:hypothetical protein